MAKQKKHNLSLKNAAVIGATAGIVLLLAVFALMRSRPDVNSLQAGEEVARLAANIRNHYKMKPDYWGLNSESVLQDALAEGLKSVLGADIRIGQGFEAALSMPGAKSFDIVYKGLDKKNCISLLNLSLEEESRLGLIAAEIKNSKVQAVFTWGGMLPLPVSRTQAKGYCIDGPNEVLFRFE